MVVNHLKVGNDHLQTPSRSGAVLPGWRVYPVSSVVGRWQLRSADSGTLVVPHTRTTISQRDFAVSGPATWNAIKLRTSNVSVETFCTKTQKSSLRLLAPLRTLSNWHYINVCIHSFNFGLETARHHQLMEAAMSTWHSPERQKQTWKTQDMLNELTMAQRSQIMKAPIVASSWLSWISMFITCDGSPILFCLPSSSVNRKQRTLSTWWDIIRLARDHSFLRQFFLNSADQLAKFHSSLPKIFYI